MDLSTLTFGQIVFYTGVLLVFSSFIGLMIGTIGYSVKKKHLKKQLMDKYGL